MFYLKWTENDITNLSQNSSLKVLLTEVDSDGNVKREVGVDENENIVHKAPTEKDNYGLFDNQPIDTASLRNDCSKEEFEELWNRG